MIRSAQEFIALRTSDNPAEYLRAANDSAPIEVWREVIRDFPSMREWVVLNKQVPIEILYELARDPSAEVRAAVAMKNKCPKELMWSLADDPAEAVRQRIAHNKNTPRGILEGLTHDSCESVSTGARAQLKKIEAKERVRKHIMPRGPS